MPIIVSLLLKQLCSTQAHALHFTTMVTPQNTNIPETLKYKHKRTLNINKSPNFII